MALTLIECLKAMSVGIRLLNVMNLPYYFARVLLTFAEKRLISAGSLQVRSSFGCADVSGVTASGLSMS